MSDCPNHGTYLVECGDIVRCGCCGVFVRDAEAWQKCPVCVGRGKVPMYFYDPMFSPTDARMVPCASCEGRGMVR